MIASITSVIATRLSADGLATYSDVNMEGIASVAQVDGRIYVLDCGNTLLRFMPDPTEGFKLDSSFGDSGVVTVDSPEGEAWGLAVGIDGQVVAVGTKYVSGSSRLSMVSYNGTVRQYVQQDANFNVTSLTDAAGVVTERYLYDPYGAVTVLDEDWSEDADKTSDQGQVYLFQGGRLDGTSGLYHFRNRDLSPTLGRWMSKDPIGYVDGMSLYLAMRGNPVRFLDPLGLAASPYNGIAPVGGIQPPQGGHHACHQPNQPEPGQTGNNSSSTPGQPKTPYPHREHFPPEAPPGWTPEYWELWNFWLEANGWNVGQPGWSFLDNECEGQSKALEKFLQNQAGLHEHWDFNQIGGSSGLLNHHVVEVVPKNGNPYPPLIFDPFHGPFNWNIERNVTVQTKEEWLEQWPEPVRDQADHWFLRFLEMIGNSNPPMGIP